MSRWIAIVLLALITFVLFRQEQYLAAVFSGWCGGVVADQLYDASRDWWRQR